MKTTAEVVSRIALVFFFNDSRRRAGLLRSGLLLLVAAAWLLAMTAHAAVFTSNTTISETNLTYDGQDIVISGATLCNSSFDIRPSEFPRSLPLTHGAVLTHSPCTASATHKLAPRMSRETAIDE